MSMNEKEFNEFWERKLYQEYIDEYFSIERWAEDSHISISEAERIIKKYK